MRLPYAELAVVDVAKLRDYGLDMAHPRGKHKAKVFKSRLGLTADDAEFLRAVLLEADKGIYRPLIHTLKAVTGKPVKDEPK